MSAPRRARRLATYEWGTYIVLPSGTRPYRVITMDPQTGRQIERTAHSESDARELARQLDAYRAEGMAADAARTIARLADLTVEGLIDSGATDSYWGKVEDILRLHVVPHIGDVRVEDWDSAVTEVVLNAARANVGSERHRDVWAAVRATIRRGRILRWIPSTVDPLLGLKAPRVQGSKPIDRDTLPTLSECVLVEEALEEVLDEHWRIGVELVRESMVRWGEFLALVPECFGFVDGDGRPLRQVRLTEAVSEVRHRFKIKDLKNHNNRTTSFHPWIEPRLELLLESSAPGERMFTHPGGGYPDRKWWSRKWRAALDAAGFLGTGWTIHTWRSIGACTWIFDRRADLGAVSEALGHSSVDFTLRRYTGARGSVARTLTDVGALTAS